MALTDNLVSYWKLDEESGTRVDSHGDNDLTDVNTVGYGTGKINNAADFEASNSEYLQITDAAQSGLGITGDMSCSCWVNAESLANPGDNAVATKFAEIGNQRGWFWGIGQSIMRFGISSNGSSYTNKSPAFSFSTATWYHIAFSYDASAGTIDWWVNGSAGTQQTGLPTSIFDNTAPFMLGWEPDHNHFDGLIDEFGIWNRTLTSTEITELYNSGNGLEYPFSSGNNNSAFFQFM